MPSDAQIDLIETALAGPRKVVATVAASPESGRLTPEQIKNWRNVLCGMIGPYALIMSDADVQGFRDQMQARLDES